MVHRTATWGIAQLHGASHSYMVHRTATWCIAQLHGASHSYMVHRTATWCIAQLHGASAKKHRRSRRKCTSAKKLQKLLLDRFPRPWDTIVQQLLRSGRKSCCAIVSH